MADFGALGCAFFSEGLRHRYVDVEGGRAIEVEVDDQMRGPAGSVHGGLIAMLVDVAGATCIAMAAGRVVATASATTQYLAAGRIGPIRAIGSPLRVSESLGVAEVRVSDVGKDDRLIAIAHVTCGFLSGDAFAYRRA